jgi:hypothetical protein
MDDEHAAMIHLGTALDSPLLEDVADVLIDGALGDDKPRGPIRVASASFGGQIGSFQACQRRHGKGRVN